jgi:hypothetical protein
MKTDESQVPLGAPLPSDVTRILPLEVISRFAISRVQVFCGMFMFLFAVLVVSPVYSSMNDANLWSSFWSLTFHDTDSQSSP